MKKNKVIFLATEIILCVLALFFTFKMFDQNETEKKVAVIVQNSGDKNWNSFIKGLKESAKVNNIHLIICNADEINNIDDQKELINEQIENGVDKSGSGKQNKNRNEDYLWRQAIYISN